MYQRAVTFYNLNWPLLSKALRQLLNKDSLSCGWSSTSRRHDNVTGFIITHTYDIICYVPACLNTGIPRYSWKWIQKVYGGTRQMYSYASLGKTVLTNIWPLPYSTNSQQISAFKCGRVWHLRYVWQWRPWDTTPFPRYTRQTRDIPPHPRCLGR